MYPIIKPKINNIIKLPIITKIRNNIDNKAFSPLEINFILNDIFFEEVFVKPLNFIIFFYLKLLQNLFQM